MTLANIAEQLVWENIDSVMDKNPGMCRCDNCKSDIAAYTLNRIKPYYVVSDKGSAISRTQFIVSQNFLDLIIALTEAVEMVSAHPHHTQENQ